MNEDDYEYESDVFCDKCFSSNFDCVNCTTEPLKAVIAELLAACMSATGAYEALALVGADKHLPGYDSCLAALNAVIAKAKGMQ